jgi:hypothetical protein
MTDEPDNDHWQVTSEQVIKIMMMVTVCAVKIGQNHPNASDEQFQELWEGACSMVRDDVVKVLNNEPTEFDDQVNSKTGQPNQPRITWEFDKPLKPR